MALLRVRIEKLEAEIAEYRLAEKERNELELAEIQETEKLHKENEKLKEENEELRQYHEWDKVANIKWMEEKEKNEWLKEEITQLKEENDVLQKFIAGNLDCVAEVKALISRDWNKEFIENNQERWEEVGLDWDSDDV
tara:strand:- start:91 stop:504 length:414 start_codon:yes stop_codon:yes gene_type:complete